jgi:hypothetical protein
LQPKDGSEIEVDVVLIDVSLDGWNDLGRFALAPKTILRKPSGHI